MSFSLRKLKTWRLFPSLSVNLRRQTVNLRREMEIISIELTFSSSRRCCSVSLRSSSSLNLACRWAFMISTRNIHLFDRFVPDVVLRWLVWSRRVVMFVEPEYLAWMPILRLFALLLLSEPGLTDLHGSRGHAPTNHPIAMLFYND